jgi:hypothetical protein
LRAFRRPFSVSRFSGGSLAASFVFVIQIDVEMIFHDFKDDVPFLPRPAVVPQVFAFVDDLPPQRFEFLFGLVRLPLPYPRDPVNREKGKEKKGIVAVVEKGRKKGGYGMEMGQINQPVNVIEVKTTEGNGDEQDQLMLIFQPVIFPFPLDEVLQHLFCGGIRPIFQIFDNLFHPNRPPSAFYYKGMSGGAEI